MLRRHIEVLWTWPFGTRRSGGALRCRFRWRRWPLRRGLASASTSRFVLRVATPGVGAGLPARPTFSQRWLARDSRFRLWLHCPLRSEMSPHEQLFLPRDSRCRSGPLTRCWMDLRSEASLGQKRGWLQLLDSAAATPNMSRCVLLVVGI